MRVLVLLLLGALAGACLPRPSARPALDGSMDPLDAGVCGGCRAFVSEVAQGMLPAVLPELSGLVASRRQPPYLYAHNDSGDTARFFALTPAGVLQAEYVLTGASAVDWEDIALGPCVEGTCLFLGDIGDNRHLRTDHAVYRVPEPRVPAEPAPGPSPVSFVRLAFQYPQGVRHNAEALVVDPESGRLYVITKGERGEPSFVFRFPEDASPSEVATLLPVARLSVPQPDDLMVTAADASPCGDALLVRMYNRLVLMRREPGADFESLFTQAPVPVPVLEEPQGEAVAFTASGQGYFTASEVKGAPVPLNVARCR